MTNRELARALDAGRATALQAKDAALDEEERLLALEVGRHATAMVRAIERWMAARLSRATEENDGSR